MHCIPMDDTMPNNVLQFTLLLFKFHFQIKELNFKTKRDSLISPLCVNVLAHPSPVAQLSYCQRASFVVIFSHFRLLFLNRWMDFGETSRSCTKFVFSPDRARGRFRTGQSRSQIVLLFENLLLQNHFAD